MASFESNGKTYTIGYNIGRVELLEDRLGHSVMAEFASTGGMFSLSTLSAFFSCGLREEGGAYVNPGEAAGMFPNVLQENGYDTVLASIAEALERDCAFFFMKAPKKDEEPSNV